MIVYSDGFFVQEENFHVSPFSEGFQFGFGFFTTIRTDDRKPLLLTRHVKRLSDSLRAHFMPVPPEMEELDRLNDLVDRLHRENGMEKGRLKFIAYREGRETRFIAMLRPLPEHPGTVTLQPVIVSGSDSSLRRYKSMNYGEFLLAREKAVASNHYDALVLEKEGGILETTTANIFFMKGKAMVTPPLESPILPGIMRGRLIELCRNVSLFDIREEPIHVNEIEEYDASFLTNSLFGILPVRAIGDIFFSAEPVEAIGRFLNHGKLFGKNDS